MKIPVVPIHIVTSRTLEEKLRAARDEGVAEGKAFKKKQLEMLLYDKTMKPIRLKAKRKEAEK